jgi:hypothetical protein
LSGIVSTDSGQSKSVFCYPSVIRKLKPEGLQDVTKVLTQRAVEAATPPKQGRTSENSASAFRSTASIKIV